MECVPEIPLEEVYQDTPELRSTIASVQSDVESFIDKLHKINQAGKAYIQAGQAFAKLGDSLATELLSFQLRRREGEETPRFQHFLMKLGDVLKQVESDRQKLLSDIEKFVFKPIEFFLEDDCKDFRLSKRNYEKAKNSYDGFLEKNFSTAAKRERFRQEFEDHRLQLSDMTFEYVRVMMDFERRKESEFVDYFSKLPTENESFYSSSAQKLNGFRSEIDDIKQFCTVEKDKIDAFRQDASQKRRKKINRQKSVMYLMKTTRKVNKEGYLYKKSRNLSMKDWNRRYFVIRNGQMFYYKQHKDNIPQGSINLMLTSVKEVSTSDQTYCMEVITNQRSYLLQAESPQELREWISVIQNCTTTLLEAQMIANSPETSDVNDPLTALWTCNPKNRECADCGTPDPEWASINLGILLCIGCSGIHRSLGVHISKVRSLTLDRCDNNLLNYMKAIGNQFANSVWESGVATRLSMTTEQPSKQTYIQEKYASKKFVPKYQGSQEELDEELFSSISNRDIQKAYRTFVHGAKVNSIQGTTLSTPAHIAVEKGDLVCLDFLLLNDADMKLHNSMGLCPIHIAVQKNDSEKLQLLLNRGGRHDIACGSGPSEKMTPLEISTALGHSNCSKLLRTFKSNGDLEAISEEEVPEISSPRGYRPSFGESSVTSERSRTASTSGQRGSLDGINFFRRFAPQE